MFPRRALRTRESGVSSGILLSLLRLGILAFFVLLGFGLFLLFG